MSNLPIVWSSDMPLCFAGDNISGTETCVLFGSLTGLRFDLIARDWQELMHETCDGRNSSYSRDFDHYCKQHKTEIPSSAFTAYWGKNYCPAEQGITIGYCMNIVSYEEGVSTWLRPPIALIYLLFYNKPLPQPLIYAFNVSAHSFFFSPPNWKQN